MIDSIDHTGEAMISCSWIRATEVDCLRLSWLASHTRSQVAISIPESIAYAGYFLVVREQHRYVSLGLHNAFVFGKLGLEACPIRGALTYLLVSRRLVCKGIRWRDCSAGAVTSVKDRL